MELVASHRQTRREAEIRRLYETPAAVVLHAAHAALESATGVYAETSLKQHIRQVYPELIMHGLWFTPLRARSTRSTPSFSPR